MNAIEKHYLKQRLIRQKARQLRRQDIDKDPKGFFFPRVLNH